jgi:hypothetical protein
VTVEGGGVAVAGDSVLVPDDDPSGEGELRGLAAPLAPVVPCIVVLEPAEPASLAPGIVLLPGWEPILPGCVLGSVLVGAFGCVPV